MYYFIIVVILAASVAVLIYNKLISNRNDLAEIYEKLDAALAKEYEHLPAFIDAVKLHAPGSNIALDDILEKSKKRVSKKLHDKPKTKEKLDIEIKEEMLKVISFIQDNPDLREHPTLKKKISNWGIYNKHIDKIKLSYNEAVKKHNEAFEKMPGKMFATIMSYVPQKPIE